VAIADHNLLSTHSTARKGRAVPVKDDAPVPVLPECGES